MWAFGLVIGAANIAWGTLGFVWFGTTHPLVIVLATFNIVIGTICVLAA